MRVAFVLLMQSTFELLKSEILQQILLLTSNLWDSQSSSSMQVPWDFNPQVLLANGQILTQLFSPDAELN